ncbi:MAG: hypothetical protein JWP04_3501 [Belnapia sp.]|jgi:hypothetical protein|nr:hypothetical protein [Belnapia sp.]
MAYGSARNGSVIKVDRQVPDAGRPVEAVDDAARDIMPAIDALRAVGADLDRDNLDAAWVDLDNAELELRCQESHAMVPQPALGKALGAVERARENMAQAEVAQASADIDQAILMLRRP